MKALYLEFQGYDKNIVKKLLRGMDFSDSLFDIGHLEAREDFFIHPDWVFFDFRQQLASDAKHFLLQSDQALPPVESLELYVRHKGVNPKHVETYKDLVEHQYDLAIKVTGRKRILVYAAKEDLLMGIMKNIKKNHDVTFTAIESYENLDLNQKILMGY